jgi:hypothetical protein
MTDERGHEAKSREDLRTGMDDRATVKLSSLFEALLNSASHLANTHQHGAAVLVAQTALEVCTERIITRSLLVKHRARSIPGRFRPYVITTDHTKWLYELLTGDMQIGSQSFWQPLTEHVKRRNGFGHSGQPVERKDAADSVAAVAQAIAYISSVAASVGLDLGD